MKDGDFKDWLWTENKYVNRQYVDFWDEAAFPVFENLPDKGNVDLDIFQTAMDFPIVLGDIGLSWAR